MTVRSRRWPGVACHPEPLALGLTLPTTPCGAGLSRTRLSGSERGGGAGRRAGPGRAGSQNPPLLCGVHVAGWLPSTSQMPVTAGITWAPRGWGLRICRSHQVPGEVGQPAHGSKDGPPTPTPPRQERLGLRKAPRPRTGPGANPERVGCVAFGGPVHSLWEEARACVLPAGAEGWAQRERPGLHRVPDGHGAVLMASQQSSQLW